MFSLIKFYLQYQMSKLKTIGFIELSRNKENTLRFSTNDITFIPYFNFTDYFF